MLTDPKFKWTPSHKTDVRETWRKFGWMPIQKPVTSIQETWRKFGWRPMEKPPKWVSLLCTVKVIR